ncbi:hypothetical protein [Bradyrhizobium japonicum]|uniref:hypothetical protein n=1 Tax=Bradyrhizobium japonicum TaxID=375 RepID=UPI001BA9F5BE|nr:hypothetical protein [Bradyrhizobium japonicum]MBR0959465.1 hypothetical protein [Bradyrhizobium japonicum]
MPITPRLLQSAAASILLLTAASSGAHAARTNVTIAGNGFSSTILKVVSENGTSWTKIEGSTISLPVKVHITSSYPIVNYKVRQLSHPEGMYFVNVSPDKKHDDEVNFSTTYEGSTDFMTAAEKQAVIAACNKKLSEGKGIRESHNTFGSVGVELIASFLTPSKDVGPLPSGGLGPTDKHTANVVVPVECEGKHGKADDVAAKEPNFSVKDIHLRFMTSAGHVTSPNAGAKCQMTHARVRVGTSKAGGVKFKLWTKVGNEPMQSQFVEAWSSFVSPGKYEAVFTKKISVSKTTSVQAMAEDKTNPIGQSTGWKQVSLDCTGAGGGGFASTPNPVRPSDRPLPGRLVGHETRPVPVIAPVRPGFGEARPARQAHATGAKEQFSRAKPHVN